MRRQNPQARSSRMFSRGAVLTGLAAAVLVAAAAAQQRDPKQYQQVLENPHRVAGLQVDRVIAALDIKPGARVADLGAGTGVFAIPLARAVGKDGRIYAIDIDPGLLDIVAAKAKAEGLDNIRTVTAGERDPRLPEPESTRSPRRRKRSAQQASS